MDITGQLDIIEFYAYLLTKQNKEKQKRILKVKEPDLKNPALLPYFLC